VEVSDGVAVRLEDPGLEASGLTVAAAPAALPLRVMTPHVALETPRSRRA